MLSSARLLARSRGLLQHSCRLRHASGIARPDVQTAKNKKPAPSPENLDKFLQMAESHRLGFDPWGQPIPLLDLHVPTPRSALPKVASLQDRFKFLRLGLENRVSNVITMFRIARTHSLPWRPTVSPWSPQVFQTSSTRSNTWLEPLRKIALDSYEQINTSVARNDLNTIRYLTDGPYQKRLMARMKALHSTNPTRTHSSSKKASSRVAHVWRLHSLASPVRCVSIRCTQGHFGKGEPSIGTRWVVQACLRFDTWQSLAIISPSSSLAPEPKRVLEYLVFERRMWYDGPWVLRDQLWEGILGQFEGVST